jgi:acetolactate synthase-1/2/3 large subunit
MEMSLKLHFANTLIEAGIDHVFGMPGGNTPFLFDGLFERRDKIRTVLARQEGGAACMADMYGRITGKPALLIGQGAWIGTSGGYGIIESYMAGVPMLIIGDTSDYFSLSQSGPYQNSTGNYGAIDLPNIMKSMTKYTTVAHDASELLHGLQLAIKHATTGRPGPACVLIRWNVPFANADLEALKPKYFPLEGYLRTSPPSISTDDAEKIADMLLNARKPVMAIGRGIHSAKAYDQVQELAELIGIPVATSYMGKSGIAETHDCAVGTMGTIGQKVANEIISNADLILAVGTCLAPDNTKWLATDFIKPEQQKIIQIDIEPLNVGWSLPIEVGVTADAKGALREIIRAIKDRSTKFDVKRRIEDLKKKKSHLNYFNEDAMFSDNIPIAPERLVRELNEVVSADDLVVLDSGNNRMWMAHYFKTKSAGQLFAAGGVAAVGYGAAASLATQMLYPKKRVVCVTGDGGLMMHLYVLEMAKQYALPLTYVVMNNSCLGNVMDYQAPDRRIATEYPQPNFAEIAGGFGLDSIRVEKPEEVQAAIRVGMETEKPYVVEVIIDDYAHFKMIG